MLARKFLMLCLMISHKPQICLGEQTEWLHRRLEAHRGYGFMYERTDVLLSTLLQLSLKDYLRVLEQRLFHGERKMWPTICLSLCLVFFGVESMQVDVYLRHTREDAERECESMKRTSLDVLAELFRKHTSGSSPLDLDWEEPANHALVDSDTRLILCLRRLQEVQEKYCM